MEGEEQGPAGDSGRMIKLSKALDMTIEKSLKRVTYKAFCNCFPKELTDENPELFQAAHATYVDTLRANIKDELDIVIEKREVEEKLEELDGWKEKAKEEKLRQSLGIKPLEASPLELVEAAEKEAKQKEKERLTLILAQLEEETATLKAEIVRKQEHKKEMVQRFNKNIEQLGRVVSLFREWNQSEAKQWLYENSETP